jgi:vacuolar-type H+-ATPase subunit H
VADFQKQFSEAEERRRQEAQAAEDKRKGLFETAEADRKERSKKSLEVREVNAKSLLDEIEAKRTRAEELVYVIANTGMVGGYQQVANRALRQSIVW